MGFKLSSLKTDAEKEEHGAWVDYIHGIRLKIAHVSNPRYQAASLKLIREARANLDDDKEVQEAVIPATAKHLLLGWENVDDDDGKALPYTAEAGEKYLREVRPFRDFVHLVCRQDVHYRMAEDARGNLSRSSNGSSATAKA